MTVNARWDQQQSVLASVVDLPAPTPDCWTNSAQPGFDGSPKASPATWCVCDHSVYPTISASTTDSLCAYTSTPSSTLSISFAPPGSESPTSCRFFTQTFAPSQSAAVTGTFTGCSCNDDKQWPVTSYTIGSSTSMACAATSISTPSPTPTLPPATNIDGGELQCLSDHNANDRSWYMSPDEAQSAISNFCDGIIPYETIGPSGQSSDGAWMNRDTTQYPPVNPIQGSIFYNGGNCDPLTFSDSSSKDQCHNNLQETLQHCKCTLLA